LFDDGPLDFTRLPEDTRREIATANWDSTNGVLRYGANRIDDSDKIDELFDNYGVELNQSVKGFRGVSGRPYPSNPGETFTDKGYLRFSGEKDVAEDFIPSNSNAQFLEIRTPSGKKMLPGDHVREKEVYLERGSTFKVVDVEKKSNGGFFNDEGEPVEAFIEKIVVEIIN